MKNIQLGYNLPQSLLNKVGIDFLRVEFKVGDQLEISKNTIFESINDKYYMLILKGLRYDLLKEDIKIIQ